MEKKILAIVGLGHIGGSLAASLKAAKAPWHLRGADRRRRDVDYALRRGLIDEASSSPAEAAAGADLVLLATPVGAIRTLLDELSPRLAAGQVVTDVGSTKASIVAHAASVLSGGVAFVGGHPVAGTERAGVEAAVEGLFEGRRCVLTPTDSTPPRALELVAGLWGAVGAEVSFVSPESHDRLFARLSHLPNLAAYALVNAVAASVSPAELAFGGGALRDFTRVTQSPPALWRDVCLENRGEILEALAELGRELERVRESVAQGDGAALESFFQRAGEVRGTQWRR
ncbi:MAG: prephenate dehydrogenase [Deltaproteobacteria bacterium]|nr:prephenate dehydrogenase [Deltaproteobacteria bacterium]